MTVTGLDSIRDYNQLAVYFQSRDKNRDNLLESDEIDPAEIEAFDRDSSGSLSFKEVLEAVQFQLLIEKIEPHKDVLIVNFILPQVIQGINCSSRVMLHANGRLERAALAEDQTITCGKEKIQFHAGDIVEVTIPEIGTLKNPVVSGD